MSAGFHCAVIGGCIGFALDGRPPVEQPRIALIRVLGAVPVESVAEEPLPPLTIEVAVAPPPEPAEFRPVEEEPPRFEEPELVEEPPFDPLGAPRLARLPENWTDRLHPEPVEVAQAAPPEEAAPPSDAGRVVDPVPIDELNAPPRYPPRAIQLRFEGRVMLRVQVAADGRVCRCDIGRSSGYAILDRAAVAAVTGWSFRDGPGELDLPIDFVLQLRGD